MKKPITENYLIKIGNFMADGIRGQDYLNYEKDIQIGIQLHRAIDTYTDAHPIFRKSKHRLHNAYGHYSGVIIDIFYDHFLAKNWSLYSKQPLEAYIDTFYKSLKFHDDKLTPKTQNLLYHMISQNWLLSYASIEGISKILLQMDHRTEYKSKMQYAPKELKMYYTTFENEFFEFFDDLVSHCAIEIKKL
jgi:acyl carrier protein phosphodiesterase